MKIQFVKPTVVCGVSYSPGDAAELPDEKAQRYCESGMAIPADRPKRRTATKKPTESRKAGPDALEPENAPNV